MDAVPPSSPLDELYATTDFSRTAVGPPQAWTPALRSALALVRQTRFPAALFWGPDHVMLYNDAYAPLIGDKHPAALGAPAAEVFPEIWDDIGPLLRGVLAGGGAVRVDDALLPLHRSGFLEECWFTFSYSAVSAALPADGSGAAEVEGVVDIAVETTTQVQDRRRLALLSQLQERLADVAYLTDAVHQALRVLRSATSDLAAVDIHLPGHPHGAAPGSGAGLPPRPTRPARSWLGGDTVLERDGGVTTAWLPLSAGDGLEGVAVPAVLVVRLHPMLAVDERYLQFLHLVAAALTQAVGRVQVREERRRAAAAGRAMSEALQRSLLDRPARPERLDLAVRYQPATERAQVGGDWYDAFTTGPGELSVVVGDVSGHDRDAAVAMAQLRGLLRGVALSTAGTPSAVLGDLEAAMAALQADVQATAVLARVREDGPGGAQVTWCSAGHPPPVLLGADGSAVLLDDGADLLLGVQVERGRTDHRTSLPPGAALVLYTDGLVERRGEPLSASLDALAAALHGRVGSTAEELCDLLLARVAVGAEDDVAVLVLRNPG